MTRIPLLTANDLLDWLLVSGGSPGRVSGAVTGVSTNGIGVTGGVGEAAKKIVEGGGVVVGAGEVPSQAVIKSRTIAGRMLNKAIVRFMKVSTPILAAF